MNSKSLMPSLRVMCVRKRADDNYKLSAQRAISYLLDELRKRVGIKEIWIVHEGSSRSGTIEDNIEIYNGLAFSDGSEIIRFLRPDILILSNDYEYLQRSLLKAAEAQGVPTVDIIASAFGLIELDEGHPKGKFAGSLRLLKDHPRSIISRYFFLQKTLVKSRYGIGYIVKNVFKDAYLPFRSWTPRFKYGGGDLNIVSTPLWADLLARNGIEKNKIAVTGDISLDGIYHRLKEIKTEAPIKIGDKIQVLLITSPMVEHGLWTDKMREEIVTGLGTAITQQLRNSV